MVGRVPEQRRLIEAALGQYIKKTQRFSCVTMQEEPGKVDKLLNLALTQFSQILAKGEESNIFAAHGAAAVLAEQATRANPPKVEYLLPAKRILDKVISTN